MAKVEVAGKTHLNLEDKAKKKKTKKKNTLKEF